jgi:outer membrane protein TolC
MISFLPFSRPDRLQRTALVVIASLAPAIAHAQGPHVTLGDALERATVSAVPNRVARAASDAANAGRMSAWRTILPTLRVDAGFVRTTDPVGAFGTSLRQQRITSADFDPARLNFPAPINNFTGALIFEQPVFMLDGWLAARAGTRASEGARSAAEWTALTTQSEVIDAWFRVILAAERANTMTMATQGARAHVRQAEAMLEAGFVTKSDVLLAESRAGELEIARLDAVRDSVLSRGQLTLLLGDGSLPLPATLGGFPADSVVERFARDVAELDSRPRADVQGAEAGVAAAVADVNRARATMVPRLVSFARRDLHSADVPFGGSSNWSVGIMASWSLFSGAAEVGDRRGAEARRASAAAQLAGALANADLDAQRSALSLQASLARLAIARSTAKQSEEAHRIVTRKYEGGLATVVELLDAAIAETQARLGLSAARHSLITSIAERLRATGHEPARLAALGDSATAGR